jgi:hypothetical protein
MAVEGAGDTEFGFDAHDSPLHNSRVLAEGGTGVEHPPTGWGQGRSSTSPIPADS